MNNKTLKWLVAAAVSCAASLASAAPAAISADFVFGWSNYGIGPFSGHISATDLNNDGLITANEVTSIFEAYGNHNQSTLYDIGTITIATQQWTPDGIAWQGTANVAYMTFDNRNWSCNTSNGCQASFTSFEVTGGNVPEPVSLALVGLALGTAGFAARKRQSR